MMTMTQLLKWTGSAKAQGWLGRRTATADFQHMAEMCGDIAKALDAHRDIDANELLARLQGKLDTAKRAPVFGAPRRKRAARMALDAE